MSDCRCLRVTPLSSQTTARPDGRHLVRKPSRNSDWQTVVSPAVRVSGQYEKAAPPWWTLNQTVLVLNVGGAYVSERTAGSPPIG
jgi:hypothetical protein